MLLVSRWEIRWETDNDSLVGVFSIHLKRLLHVRV